MFAKKIYNSIYSGKITFWKANVIAWFVFSILWIVLYTPAEYYLKDGLKILISNFAIPVLFTSLLRYIYSRLTEKNFSLGKIILIIASSALISAILWYILDTTFTLIYYSYPLSIIKDITFGSFAKRLIGIYILIALWCTIYFIIKLFYQWQNEKEAKERAMYNALESRIEALKNQLNPHFLFNSLTSISSLVDENPAKAKKVIRELSGFLRYSLTYKNSVRTNLRRELDFINHYVYIQSIRFEENFKFTLIIDPETESFLIPTAILYPIVENAIKYGMESSNRPLNVVLQTYIEGDFFIISVKNSGNWIDEALQKSTGTNTGMYNVRERLNCEYVGKSTFNIENHDNWVVVKIGIPLDKV